MARLVIAATAFLAAAGGARSDYTLQPGDTLNVSVTGLNELAATAAIDNDGYLRFPLFKPVRAAGTTLTALQEQLRSAAAGRVLRRYDSGGAPIFVTLNPDDVYLSVADYRPVHVYGAVGRPGAFPFRPGITVRAAIAAAGGIATVSSTFRGMGALELGARLQGDFRAMTQERARLQVQLWRIDAALGDTAAPPDPDSLGISAATTQALIDTQREMLALTEKQRNDERDYLTRTIAQTEERIAILTEQERRLTEGLETDEDETRRISSLRQKGVVAADRLSDVKRAEVLSASRLLDTQNDLEAMKIARIRFLADLESLEGRRRERLLAERQTVTGRLDEIGVRLTSLRDQMAANGIATAALDATLQATALVLMHRRQGDKMTSFSPDLDEVVEPGDVIEAQLVEPAP